MAPLLTATVLAAVLIVATAAPMDKNDDAVTLSNTAPRLDADGKIVNAHDGSVIQDPVSGRFYLYGFLSFDCTADSPPHGYDNCVSCALVGNVYPVAYSSPALPLAGQAGWRSSAIPASTSFTVSSTQSAPTSSG